MSHALEVTDLEVDFAATRALAGVTAHVDYGEIVALLGPNGAGKTTLTETLLGFRAPDRGAVRVHGLDPRRDHAEVVARTGALLQRGGVWAPMSPRDVLRLTSRYYEAPRDPDELVALLDLGDCARTPWRRLSGGEQQRTLLALALLGRPKALVLDEPTTAVDAEGRQVVRAIVAAERDRGCAILLTTHELVEAERLADRLVVVHRGTVVAEGTLDELAGEPEIVVEIDGPLDPGPLARLLGVPVRLDERGNLRVTSASSAERLSAVTGHVASCGRTVLALRTRPTLEERYLELIAETRESNR